MACNSFLLTTPAAHVLCANIETAPFTPRCSFAATCSVVGNRLLLCARAYEKRRCCAFATGLADSRYPCPTSSTSAQNETSDNRPTVGLYPAYLLLGYKSLRLCPSRRNHRSCVFLWVASEGFRCKNFVVDLRNGGEPILTFFSCATRN